MTKGNILGLFNPEKLHSERGAMRYVPKPGERHHIIDVGTEFEGISLLDIHRTMRVATSGVEVRLEPLIKPKEK
jgi:hypothetical protein